MAKLVKVDRQIAGHEEWAFWCPGCRMAHQYRVRDLLGAPPCEWEYNGNPDAPSFSPSLLHREYAGQTCIKICHLYLTDGIIRYLSDCTHPLGGKNIPLEDFPGV